MRGFGSDNHSGVHPQILAAIQEANQGHAPSYGTDSISLRAEKIFSELFQAELNCYFVFNGTGANVCALRGLIQPWEACLVSSQSHLNVDECGAPERLAGKLIPVPTQDGKLKLKDLEAALIRKGDQHFSQIKAVSLTQPTELGTCYSLSEIQSICGWAKKNQLKVHIDGARLANAIEFLKTSFYEMLVKPGVDVVSFGGTKNGLLFGEALLVLNSTLNPAFSYIRKQSLQLPSKSRFVGAQFCKYLEGGLYSDIAAHSLKMAQYLRSQVEQIAAVKITQPTESNAVFATIPKSWVSKLREHHFFYVWDSATTECRWMCSWDTSTSDIDSFAELMKTLPSPSL